MRCSCQNCGEYMVQDERGLESRCICPQCLNTCAACMGTPVGPQDRDSLVRLYEQRREDDRFSPPEEPD